ncbi:hypothetical protein HY464_00560 [Candidatus Peregrinibacteria bacterium]|nr:hypothetical protein [Candidatus Peregrinibacteria bacterium]MBI4129165.1 hypothetical protein [Candidatus Peregrinibacteria bacterium]
MSPQKMPFLAIVLTLVIGGGIAIAALVNAQTDASVTPLTPGWGGPNYDQPLWTITYDKAIIPVSFTSYNCTSAALVLEYATWADYTKVDWQTGATGKYTGFIPASASDLSQKVSITIPNLSPSTAYIFRVGAKCTSSSPMGSLVYTTSANQFSTPAAPASKTFAGSAALQSGDAGGTVETNTTIHQKVIYLRNTGSDPDTFRTTLPINPETRCGLNEQNGPYPANTLPNTLPTTLDVPLVVNNATTYIVVVCVTKGLPTGPFTWSYKTISVGSLTAGNEKVIADVQDTVQVTETIPCSDSDGGINSSVKGIATGTYAGAITSYIAIYGQEPNPTSPKTTTDKFSTYIDHCATSTQLNEGFCNSDGRMSAIGLSCANGCKDGLCVAPPSSFSSVSSRSSLSSSSSVVSALPSSSSSLLSPPASASTLSVSSLPTSTTTIPAGQIIIPVSPSVSAPPVTTSSPLSTTTPAVISLPPVVPPVSHLAPPQNPPRTQTESTTVQKKVSKAKVQVLKKQQQALRKILRTLERSLVRKKNVAATNQIADLRDELADLDLRDPSAAETLRSLQEEIAELRLVVTKKAKPSHSGS